MKRLLSTLTAILFAVGCLCLPAAAASDDGGFSAAHTVRPCASSSAAPNTSAGRGVLMDADTGALLWSRHPDTPGLIASTTKIMTAWLACEAGALDRPVTVPPEAVGVEGSSLYLKEGEILTREELLLGAMLQSGNDAALTLAIDTAGSEADFVARMNEAARELGLQNTHYANPHGLDSEGNYGSARDLALLTARALQNPDFRRAAAARSAVVAGDRVLTNHNKLLWRCPGCIGVKTGYTRAAGRLLVSAVQRQGRTLICVTVNDPSDWQDHIALYDWAFAQYREEQVAAKGRAIMRVGELSLIAQADLTLSLAAGEEPRLVYVPGFPEAGVVRVYLKINSSEKYRLPGPPPWRSRFPDTNHEPLKMKERLQKLIAAAGLCSRRRAEEWITQGKVTVNGGLARLGDSADPERDVILVEGRPLPAAPKQTRTVLLCKPRGYVSTLSDEKGRPTVAELLPPELGRLYPVGRLDQFSEGLLLMTNNGALANRLTHPSGEVRKTYRLWVSGWHEGALALLRRPIVLDGCRIKPPEVRLIWVHEATDSRQQAAEKAFPLRGRCPSAHTGADEVAQRQVSASDQPTADCDPTSSVSRLAGDGGCHLPLKGKAGATALLEITIHEGRNRQIRRMAEAAGLTTTRLKRVAEGPISLGDLKPGEWRELSKAELDKLKIES